MAPVSGLSAPRMRRRRTIPEMRDDTLAKKSNSFMRFSVPLWCPMPGVWSGRCLRLPPDEEAREAGRQTDYRAEVSGSCGNSSLPWRRVIQMVLRLLMTAATSR